MRLTVIFTLFMVGMTQAAERPPNIVFILADDLGYGDVGCYGQKRIRTPNIDRLAEEGIRFTQVYAGCTVCAPSRCSLFTGLHTGHCHIRGNAKVALRPEDRTVAEALKAAGYTTGLFGKWGLGELDSTGIPTKKGFDTFYGYLSQTHAHNYYPDFLIRNDTIEKHSENVQAAKPYALKRVSYAPDLITNEALHFIETNKEKPFALFFTTILPHANNERGTALGDGMEVPTDAPYTNEPWPQVNKNHAAMITRLDADVGKLIEKLKSAGLERNTIVFFTSDNGPHNEGGASAAYFQSSGPLLGIKRALTEGGIRVPMIVRSPGHITPAVSDNVWAFWDIFPTLTELAHAKTPEGLDGVSIVPWLTGKGDRKQSAFLYWEFHENGSKQAVRMGDWKAIRPFGGKLQLYDLAHDLGETKDVAAAQPMIVEKIEAYLKTARTESETWSLKVAGNPKR